MNIAISYGTQKGLPIDARNLVNGNPGIGGTQYLMLLLAYYLSADDKYNITVIGSRKIEGLNKCKHFIVGSDEEVCERLVKNHIDILIIYHYPYSVLKKLLMNVPFKIIVWCHNYLYADFCKYIVQNESVKACVFVGKQQYDMYVDNDIINKSILIYNMMPDNVTKGSRVNDSKTVTYMGMRGIHRVCRIWKDILKHVPDAKLNIIGADNLYEDTQLGPLGVSSPEEEKAFTSYIRDDCGRVIPSVHFLGLFGLEKMQLFKQSSVGIINPSKCNETFGMGIVEMGITELPVVTSTSNGYYDTIVNNETGYICRTDRSLIKKIIYLLQHPIENEAMGKKAKVFLQKYSPELIIPQWKSLLDGVYNNTLVIHKLEISSPYHVNRKVIRAIIAYLRFNLKLHFIPSLIDMECLALKLIKRMK